MNGLIALTVLQVVINAAAPKPSALLVWHEDKRIPEKAADWEASVRATANACKLLKDGNGVPANLLMVGNGWIMGRIWKEYRPRLEAETGIAWRPGIGIDICECYGQPENMNTWYWLRQTVSDLRAQGCQTVYIGAEACYTQVWTRLPGWDYERLRFGVSILPREVGYRVYPGLVAGWPGVSDADSAVIEQNSTELRRAWRQLPDVAFVATSPLTGAEEALTPAEQRCLHLAQIAGDRVVPMVYVSVSNGRMCLPPKAARLLAAAKDPNEPVLVYLDGPVELLAGKVAAERTKFETGVE